MKIRNGFVSNSSSSSFIVAVKNGALDDAIDILYDEVAKLESKIPFSDILNSVFGHIKHNSDEFDINEYVYDGVEEDKAWEQYPQLKKLHDDGYTLYEVNVSSDDYEDGGIGMFLYENVGSIEYESEDKNLIITDL